MTQVRYRRSVDAHSLPGQCAFMSIPQSKETAQGQISVPAEVRKKLGIGPGSVLEIARKAGHLPVATFDRNFAKLDDVRRLA